MGQEGYPTTVTPPLGSDPLSPTKSCVVAVDIGYRDWRDEDKRLQFLKRAEDLRNAGYDKVVFGIALPDFSNYNYLIKPIADRFERKITMQVR